MNTYVLIQKEVDLNFISAPKKDSEYSGSTDISCTQVVGSSKDGVTWISEWISNVRTHLRSAVVLLEPMVKYTPPHYPLLLFSIAAIFKQHGWVYLLRYTAVQK